MIMPRTFLPKFRRNVRTGDILVRISTQHGVRWLSTGQTSKAEARRLYDSALIEKLQHAACAGILQGEALSHMLAGKRLELNAMALEWASELALDGSIGTTEAYVGIVNQWLTEQRLLNSTASDVTRASLSRWINQEECALATRKLRLVALKRFWEFAQSRGWTLVNPALTLRVKLDVMTFDLLEKRRTLPISPEQYELLMGSRHVKDFWRSAIPLSYWLGLRLTDVTNLQWQSFKNGGFVLHTRKTCYRLDLALDDPLLGGGFIRQVLAELLRVGDQSSPYCFPVQQAIGIDPKRRSRLSIYFQRVLVRCGIKDRRFHSLRKAAALRMREAGKTLKEIGQVLGHTSENTTRIYTDETETFSELD